MGLDFHATKFPHPVDTPLSSSGWFSKEHLARLASSYFLKYSHLSTSMPKIVLLDLYLYEENSEV